MKSFKDQMGREWIVKVDCAGLRRILDARGVNLADARELDKSLDRLRGDDLFVAEAAWFLIVDEAEKQGVKQAAFLASMWGDRIDDAAQAIYAGLADFFRRPVARELVAKFAEATGKKSTFGISSTDAQESLDAIQAA